MLERYKTLGGVLALGEFSVAELAELSGVREPTVRTILRREGTFVEQIGTRSTGRRGGQPVRWRVRPAARERLRAQLRELERLGVGPWLADQPDHDDAPRAGIIAAEDVLLRLAGTDVEPVERTELVKLAEAHLDAADASLAASDGALPGTAHRQLDRDRRVVELLLTLEQAEQDAAARRDRILEEARVQAERFTSEARSRAEALERDTQERYRRARSEISALEGDISTLSSQRDALREQVGAISHERGPTSASREASGATRSFGSGRSSGGQGGRLGMGRPTGRSLSAEAAIEGVRWKTGRESESGRATHPLAWMGTYLRTTAILDFLCALLAGLVALEARFGTDIHGGVPTAYFAFTAALPFLWLGSVGVAGGYDPRFIGVGTEEFRRVLNAAVALTAGVAIVSYVAKLDLARGYLVVALPCAFAFDLAARYFMRKRLHRRRRVGQFMRRTVAVGHAAPVADLVTLLRRDSHHGLAVVAACVAGTESQSEVADVPVYGGLDSVPSVVSQFNADTVAVLSSPEMDSARLRELAWDLEETGTDLWVASALLDVAGPRTTIHPVAGLPLLHVDHAELAGGKRVIKGIFDKITAALALILLAPLFVAIALTIKVTDHGPVFFRQARIGKDGTPFKVWKFRTMVVDAEAATAQFLRANEADRILFKMRQDPRITRVGAWLRRCSLDKLPQLFNVLRGNMSLVGPRPALPVEVKEYGNHMRRRLAVKPGITGLWQVSGRSDLSWDEAMRLDVRYVENWSLALDLQIIWKTLSAVARGSSAY
jgi:exopolysaccharide biosynthesis polyprenyl glycosylphosphotransferase